MLYALTLLSPDFPSLSMILSIDAFLWVGNEVVHKETEGTTQADYKRMALREMCRMNSQRVEELLRYHPRSKDVVTDFDSSQACSK